MHDIKHNYDIILRIIKGIPNLPINEFGNIKRAGPKPKISDIETIALFLTAEYMETDSENNFFVRLKAKYISDFPNLPDRTAFNRKRRYLFKL